MPLISAWTFCAICQALLVFRLAGLNLIRVYPAFTALILSDLITIAILSLLDWHSFWYGLVWIIGEGLHAALLILVVIEVYVRALRRVPNHEGFGYTALLVIGLISVCVAFAATFMGTMPDSPVETALDIKRIVTIALLTTVLLSMALFSFQTEKVPVPTNLILHRRILALYLLVLSLASMAQLEWLQVPISNALALFSEGACYLLWIVMLSAAGEYTEPIGLFNADQRRRLDDKRREHLDGAASLNAHLLANRDD